MVVNEVSANPPQEVGEVLHTLLLRIVDNPINALLSANYIGLIAWAAALGLVLRHSADTTKQSLNDLAQAVSVIANG